MKAKLFSLAVAYLFLLSFSCKKEDAHPSVGSEIKKKNGYLIFGQYFGMCGGPDCVRHYKLQGSALFKDTTSFNYPVQQQPLQGNFIYLQPSAGTQASLLPDNIPSQLLATPNGVIGMPDAYDQGGIYVEIKTNAAPRFWKIDLDTSNIPLYLRPFTLQVKQAVEDLN